MCRVLTGIDADAACRRSFSAIGKFAAKEAGKYVGGQAADAVTGSDDLDNQRCAELQANKSAPIHS